MLEISIPQLLSDYGFWIFAGAAFAWYGRGLFNRVGRLEEKIALHEETCEAHWQKNGERLDKIEATQTEIRTDIAFIKAKLNGDKQ